MGTRASRRPLGLSAYPAAHAQGHRSVHSGHALDALATPTRAMQ